MRLDIHVHLHDERSVLTLLRQLIKETHTMSAALDRLTTEVTETSGVVDSAIALIEGLAEQIRALATDPAALNALADELDAKTNALSAAVAAQTPAPPVPAPPTVPVEDGGSDTTSG